MRVNKSYSEEFKKSIVAKLLNRGSRTIKDISEEVGIPSTTIYGWIDKSANIEDMKNPRSPQSRTAKEKLKILNEFNETPIDKQGEYIRKSGVHKEHMIEWQRQIEEALCSSKQDRKDKRALIIERRKNNELEKEVRRKDKALAEVSALLILKKKADLIWGTKEEE